MSSDPTRYSPLLEVMHFKPLLWINPRFAPILYIDWAGANLALWSVQLSVAKGTLITNNLWYLYTVDSR